MPFTDSLPYTEKYVNGFLIKDKCIDIILKFVMIKDINL